MELRARRSLWRYRKEMFGLIFAVIMMMAFAVHNFTTSQPVPLKEHAQPKASHQKTHLAIPEKVKYADGHKAKTNDTAVQEPTIGSDVVDSFVNSDGDTVAVIDGPPMDNDVLSFDVNGAAILGDGIGYITVEKGDTLWDIAKMIYGDGSKWTELWDLNKDGLIKADSRNVTQPGHWLHQGQILKTHK